jgi:esterase/lipase superfamily enzyme
MNWRDDEPLRIRLLLQSDHRVILQAETAVVARDGTQELVLSPRRDKIRLSWNIYGKPGTGFRARIEIVQGETIIGSRELLGSIPDEGLVTGGDVLHRETFDIREASLPMAATRSLAQTDDAEYTVFYATNRRRVFEDDPSRGYSAGRGTGIYYGTCKVFVPKSHKIGSTGSPWWKRIFTDDDRLKLLEIRGTNAVRHWQEMHERLASLGEDDQHAVLFVHGYNVSFDEAAIRAAQLGFDLSIKGPMAFFSWPSQGTLEGYLADAATIEASEEAITSYLSDFATSSGAKSVHVIAHSMGNRGVLRAVQRIAAGAQARTGVPFAQFILAAADVDADTFRSLAAAYRKVARRTTLYVSSRDRAVEASRWLHHFPRAGLVPPVFVAPDVDTINVTNADLTALGHGYVGSARDVLQDMHDLIRHDAPPDQRFGLREARTAEGQRYWLIGA